MRRAVVLGWVWLLFIGVNAGYGQTLARIAGAVTDASTSRPLVGATISIAEARISTLSGADGRFVLTDVPPGTHSVIASTLGYGEDTRTVTVNADDGATVDFSLQPQALLLEGITAIGYGTQLRRDVTGAVGSVNVEEMGRIPTPNAVIAMKGKVAGVDITPDGYAPGAGMRVRVRGARSINATNEPLYVVDGIPLAGGIQDFNAADIESVDILKDASASAIYGSRGANGVVLITTNRGRRGGTQLTYDVRYGWASALNRVDLQDGEAFAQYKRDAFRAAGRYSCPAGVVQCAEGDAALFSDPADQYWFSEGRYTDWQDLMLRRAPQQQHSLTIAGGDDRTRFSVSGEYYDEVGIVRGQDFDRKSFRASLDHNVGRASLGLSAYLSQSAQNLSSGGNLVGLTHGNNPLAAAFDADGTPIYQFDQDPLTRNPLFQALNYIDERQRDRAFASVYGEYELADGLRFRSQLGPDLSEVRRGLFIGSETRELLGGPAEAEQWREKSFSYTFSNFLTADRRFATNHRLQATLLYEIQQETIDSLTSGRAQQLPYEHQRFHNLRSASVLGPSGSRLVETALQSYMARVNYHLLDRYVVTLTGRYDGSSRLAPGNKYSFFPSVAVAWRLGQEPFMSAFVSHGGVGAQGGGLFSDLKVRASWGRVGNSAVDPYQTQGGLARTQYNFGNSLAFGFRPNTIENPDLRWERTTQLDVGLEFGLLNNRITGVVDVYRADTDDLLMSRQLPTSSGFQSVLENIGQTRNTGIEIGLSTVNVETASGFRWTTDVNLASNKNEIISLYGGQEDDIGNRWFIGQPIHDCTNPLQLNTCRFAVFYDFEFDGIWQLGEEQQAAQFNAEPGMIRIKDQDDNGVINDDDRVILGNSYPKWTGGITNRIAFRNLDLSVFATVRTGYSIFNGIGSVQTGRYNMLNLPYWTPERPSNRYPQPNIANEVIPFQSTLWYESGSHVRVRNITLSYTLPASLAGRWGARSIRIYGQAHDPFLFTDYQGYDPESGTTANTPSATRFMLGATIGF